MLWSKARVRLLVRLGNCPLSLDRRHKLAVCCQPSSADAFDVGYLELLPESGLSVFHPIVAVSGSLSRNTALVSPPRIDKSIDRIQAGLDTATATMGDVCGTP